MSGDPDDAVLREGRETHSADSVRDKVEESSGGGDVHAVGGETVHDCTHGVLTDTVSDVLARVVTELGAGVLEVDSVAPTGQVGAGQIGGTTKKFGNSVSDLGEDSLGKLSRGNGGIAGLVGGERLLPALGKLSGDSAGNLGVLVGVLLAVGLEELGPLLVGLGTTVSDFLVSGVDIVWDNEALLGVHAELGLDSFNVVGLEGSTVGGGETLELGTEADGGLDTDDRGLVGDVSGLGDGLEETLEVLVTVKDVRNVPSVGEEALLDVFGEGAGGVTVDRDVVVIVEGDEVSELEVTSERSGLGRDTLLQATVTGEHVCVVGEEGEAVLVEGGSKVSLGDGETDRVGETLTKGTSGDLDTLGVTVFGVTWGLGVELTELLELLHGQVLVTEEVVEDVDESASVAVRKNESVTVDPLRVSGVHIHESMWCGKDSHPSQEIKARASRQFFCPNECRFSLPSRSVLARVRMIHSQGKRSRSWLIRPARSDDGAIRTRAESQQTLTERRGCGPWEPYPWEHQGDRSWTWRPHRRPRHLQDQKSQKSTEAKNGSVTLFIGRDYAVIDIENFTEPSGDQAQEVLTDGSDSLLVASSLSKRHDGYVKQRMSWGGGERRERKGDGETQRSSDELPSRRRLKSNLIRAKRLSERANQRQRGKVRASRRQSIHVLYLSVQCDCERVRALLACIREIAPIAKKSIFRSIVIHTLISLRQLDGQR